MSLLPFMVVLTLTLVVVILPIAIWFDLRREPRPTPRTPDPIDDLMRRNGF